MMWVKETLPPRARARWLLMTVRLSMSSFTGTERTLVAVGTLRLTSMFCTVRAGAPRSTVRVGSSTASGLAAGSGSLGTGEVVPGWLGRLSALLLLSVGAVALADPPVPPAGFADGLGFADDFAEEAEDCGADSALVWPAEPLVP